jgi:hypothetical protein
LFIREKRKKKKDDFMENIYGFTMVCMEEEYNEKI